MAANIHSLSIVLALLAGVQPAAAQSAQFFRVTGPTATTIFTLDAEGLLVWSNSLPGATHTVQTAPALPGGSNWVDYIRITPSSSVSSNRIIDLHPPAGMALIPAGSFTMGDSFGEGFSDELPLHTVYVSAFYLDVNLVSLSQWQGVYRYATNHGYAFVNAGLGKAANHPVQTVDWYDCVKWSNARSAQAGLTPVYYTDGGLAQVFTNGDVGTTVYANWGANGYRLPTEAEWEKAARGGVSGRRFPWGDTISGSQANYYGLTNSYAYDLGPDGFNAIGSIGGTSPATSPVGSFAPNGYGLYDMAGNVDEWCWDWYGTPYPGGSDPRGPGTGNARVLRGGYWYTHANGARCAARDHYYPGGVFYSLGFRCVRGL